MRRGSGYKISDFDPDHIFLDSGNLPEFETGLFEGRLEKPIPKRAVVFLGLFFAIVLIVFIGRVWMLQVLNGPEYAERGRSNSLRYASVVPSRGILYDRKGEMLAWNDIGGRAYMKDSGVAHLIGYVGYPKQEEIDADPVLGPKEFVGRDGVEKTQNAILRGVPGTKVVEVDAHGDIISEHIFEPGTPGSPITLSIDSRVTKKMYEYIKNYVEEYGFAAGSGVIMDVRTGEILAMTSYPEYDPNVFVGRGEPGMLSKYYEDKKMPLLNRAISGLYIPGSTVKPIFALAALQEKTIAPEKQIFSAGFITIQNPYNKELKSTFKDWKAHGWVDMRRALSVSSDVYFYALGGGYEDQVGLGITRLDKYAKMFGLGQKTGIELPGEADGNIPTPEWKARMFKGDAWRTGDTYISTIGQYGFTATPIQMAEVVSIIANDGRIIKPTIFLKSLISGDSTMSFDKIEYHELEISKDKFTIVKEGMRQGVASSEGTARALNIPEVAVAAKTGTAELGVSKARVNSWGTGFFPYDNPKYAFAVVMESGSRELTTGANLAMRNLLIWMASSTPEYIK